MYAVFESGSHQYRVSEGELVQIDFQGEKEPGSRIVFDRVLLLQDNSGTHIGQPCVPGVRILGEVVDHLSEKLTVQKFRRRKRYRRKKGHRQYYTAVKIAQILLAGQDLPPETPPGAAPPAEKSE
jgi:large subunit ribosomal protein L21